MIYISPSLVAGTGVCGGNSLRHARIGYRSITRTATISATSQATGFPASSIANALTYERWMPAVAPASIEIDAGGLVIADYVGIAAHTLGSAGATIVISHSEDGADWIDVLDVRPDNDNAIMVLFEPVMARYWRISIDRVAVIGVVNIEMSLAMIKGVVGGHSPGVLSRKTDIMPNKSEGGQFLGRSVIRKGFETEYQWENLDEYWYRSHFDPFVESAIRYPFFIAWNPFRFPNDVIYAWCNKDIQPRMQGVRGRIEVGFDVEAIA